MPETPKEFGTNTKALLHDAKDSNLRWFTSRGTIFYLYTRQQKIAR